MFFEDEIFMVLKNELDLSEKSISSHWVEYLKDLAVETVTSDLALAAT